MSFRMTVSLVALGWILGLARAQADGEGGCAKGYHDTTPAERAAMTAVLDAAMQALPAPPTGWVNTLNDDRPTAPASVCLDVVPWPYSYSRHYSRVEGKEDRDRALAAAAEESRAAMERKQPRIDALMAKLSEISSQIGPAVESGDNAKLEALRLESERVNAELQAVMEEGDATAKFEAAAADLYSDLEMSILVTVNSAQQESPSADAEPLSVPGASSASRWTADDGKQGHALVLFGEWQPSPAGFGLHSVARTGQDPRQPRTISIQYVANAKRIPALVDATNFAAMAALLAR
jgi:hypothetical protein